MLGLPDKDSIGRAALLSCLARKIGAEFIGTFALVFFGVGSVMVAQRFPDGLPPILVPLVFGLVVACIIYAIGHISGAHLNPAVTAAFFVTRHFPLKEILPYWAAQFFAAVLASATLQYLLPAGTSFGSTHALIGAGPSLVMEILISFFLMFVVVGVATDSRAQGTMAGVAIGGIVTLCAALAGPLTGASMNPARSFGPALFENNFSDLWVYFAGPFIGTILGALSYEKLRGSASRTPTQAAA